MPEGMEEPITSSAASAHKIPRKAVAMSYLRDVGDFAERKVTKMFSQVRRISLNADNLHV
jgi:hypothetical protein